MVNQPDDKAKCCDTALPGEHLMLSCSDRIGGRVLNAKLETGGPAESAGRVVRGDQDGVVLEYGYSPKELS